MTDVKPKETKPPIKKKNRFLFVADKILDVIEWDARRGVMGMLIGILLITGVTQLPIYTWQYWVFLVGILLITIPTFMRGTLYGVSSERKIHDMTFMCIPKDVLMKQAEMQKLMHEAHHERTKEGNDDDKMPN